MNLRSYTRTLAFNINIHFMRFIFIFSTVKLLLTAVIQCCDITRKCINIMYIVINSVVKYSVQMLPTKQRP